MVYSYSFKDVKKLEAEKPNKRLSQHSRPELKEDRTRMMAKKVILKNQRNIL